MKISNRLLLVLISLTLISCSNNQVTIEGKFAGIKNKNILIEEFPTYPTSFIDSTETNSNGEFKLKYDFKDSSMPVFLRIRHKNDYIILIAKPNEKIELNSLLNLSSNYIVSGSPDSELVKELNNKLSKTYDKISTLTKELNNANSTAIKNKIYREIKLLYVKQKQDNIAFLVLNSKSLASIVALHQEFPNGVSIFGEGNDLQYFKLLADSLSVSYPESKYVAGLKSTIKEHENAENLHNLISNTLINDIAVGYPNISLKDPAGVVRNLSDLDGKVIMLVMWNPQQKSTQFLNKDMKEIYDIYSEKGLEIYQVTLSENVANWIGLVKAQNIPWVSVNDPNGLRSVLIKTYNIQDLPSNYIIDRGGDIVGKNLWGNDLINKLNNLL